MFESFYGLSANPFRLSADERFRFAHRAYAKAWSYLKYAFEQGEGFVLITGRPGTGKTTLIRDIMSELDESKILAVNLVTNQFQSEELLRKVALSFGYDAQNYNKATLLTKISDHAMREHAAGRHVAIIVDEAQNLTDNGLEELRLISNLQVGNQPLFQIFLIGQEELRSMIYGQGLENIRQRIVASCRVEPMDVHQTESYIEHRLGVVGWDNDPEIEAGIYPLIQQLTHGVPREVNHIVGRLLLYGALEEKHKLTEEDLWVVVKELDREQRLGVDLEEDLQAFKEQRGLDKQDEESGQAATQVSDLAESESVKRESAAAESESPAEAEALSEAQTSAPQVDDADSAIEPVVEDEPKEAEREGFQAADALLSEETDSDDDSKTIFGMHDVYADKTEPPTELPRIEMTRRFDFAQQKQTHLLTDVDDLLDNRHGLMSGLHRKWRWLFYPVAVGVLVTMMLVPKPDEFVAYWEHAWSGFQKNYLMSGGTAVQSETPVAPPDDSAAAADGSDAIQPQADQTSADAMLPVTRPSGEEDQTQASKPAEDQTPPPATPVDESLPPATPVDESPPPETPADESPDEGNGLVAYGHVYHISVDEETGRLAEPSRPLFFAALEMLRSNQMALLVVTGVSTSEGTPIERIRSALREAGMVATLFVEAGVEKERISIEGGSPEDRPIRSSKRTGGPQTSNLTTVRFKVVRAYHDT